MSTPYTPGPWRVGTRDIEDEIEITDDGDTRTPAYAIVSRLIPPPTARANANLIAAAPDLLEACRRMTTDAHILAGRIGTETWAMLRAAIAKAEAR